MSLNLEQTVDFNSPPPAHQRWENLSSAPSSPVH